MCNHPSIESIDFITVIHLNSSDTNVVYTFHLIYTYIACITDELYQVYSGSGISMNNSVRPVKFINLAYEVFL